MRKITDPQQCFDDLFVSWDGDPELAKIDQILRRHPSLAELVVQDISGGAPSRFGQEGFSGEQILRAAVLMSLRQLTYRELADQIEDSRRANAFCRFVNQPLPSFNALEENIGAIQPDTWMQIHRTLIGFAVEAGVEDGRKARFDSTAVETNIHHPLDSRLIEDCVRIALRLMGRARKQFGDHLPRYHDRSKAVKRRVFKIANTKSKKKQVKLYRELLKLGEEIAGEICQMAPALAELAPDDAPTRKYRDDLLSDLSTLEMQFEQVLDQCRRRVVHGEKVPASEKLVSIFEPHTDIIPKGGRETVFGHKVWLSAGASNLILDCIMERGNAADSTKFTESLDRTCDLTGTVPDQIAVDDGYASEKNAEYARSCGVRDVVFGGKLNSEGTRWVRSKRTQRKLRNFRAGIEAIVSGAKRSFGLDRCTWSGWMRFQSYVWLSIVAWNRQTMARHLIE